VSTGDELSGLRIVIVEDEPETLELVALILRDAGAEVFPAATVDAGLEALERHRPDVLVSDLNLPGSAGGCDLVRRARASQVLPPAAIALSASSSLADARSAIESGFDVHVAKPISVDELVAAVRSVART